MAARKNNGRINFIIRVMIYSDFLMLSATGLINPIFGIYITQKIAGGSLVVVGYAATVLLVVKSILQLPIASYIDKKVGEKDDLYFMIAGSFLVSLTSFLYIFVTNVWHLYALQALWGVGSAMAYPAWFAIFTRHADHQREGFEWGIYSTIVGLGVAVTGAVGAVAASRFGFNAVFIMVGALSMIGTAILLPLRNYLLDSEGAAREITEA